MRKQLKSRFIVIGLIFLFSALFVWPPLDDPLLVNRTVERMVGTSGHYRNKVLHWDTGKPLVKPMEILNEDDDHVVQIHDSRWYRYFIMRRFDATPTDREYTDEREEEREFTKPDGSKKKIKIKIVRYHQVIKIRHTLNLGLDLSGGTELVYRVQTIERASDKGDRTGFESRKAVEAQADTIVDIIKRRIDISGLKEPRIQRQGADRILIQIPGKDRSHVESIEKIIQTSGKLEFRLVEGNKDIIRDNQTVVAPTYKWYEMRKNDEDEDSEPRKLLIKIQDEYNVKGSDLAQAYVTRDENGLPAVGFRFKAGHGRKFGWMTQEHIGEQVAIILDGVVFSAPVVQSRIDDVGIINGGAGGFQYQEAKNLSTILSAGSLPADLIPEMKSEVSPFIGGDSVKHGLEAILIGAVLVFIFMLLYYMVGGALADIALAFNVLILLAFMAVFHATLTLPGIAGILLTIGMAVDANVLVFERIREEEGKRNTLFQALDAGYEKAFLTILDANLTTIITAVILIYIGTGPVRGFGITLAFGILASLFTAIYVTRTFYVWLVEKEIVKRIRMIELSFLRNTAYPFLKFGRVAMFTSLVVIVIGMVFFFSRGQDNFDIDFRGGYLIHIKLREPHAIEEVRKMVSEADLRKPEVQQYGSDSSGESTEFVIRTEKDYGFDFGEEGVVRKENGIFEATLHFREKISLRNIKGRLKEYFSQVKISAAEETFTIDVKSATPDEDEVRRNIRRVLSALPKYDLFAVPEFKQALLPEAVVVLEDGLQVSLLEPAQPKDVQADIQKLGLHKATVEGIGQPDAKGSFLTLKLNVDPAKYSEAEDLLRSDKNIQLAEPFPRYTKIGKAVAGDLVFKAVAALVLSWFAILAYVGVRFHGLKYGAAAIIALIHDALFTIVVLAVADRLGLVDGKINLTMIAAILTIIGYSVNDTIVIFDRVRENLQLEGRNRPFDELVDLSNNQMLARTFLTSGLTLLALIALFAWGGGVIHGFAFAMIVGVVVGTYSSIFIACPIVVEWGKHFEETSA